MIKRIDIKGFATFNDTGVIIDDCKKINFIYGPNGSGKSTISNFIQSPHNPAYKASLITWEHNTPSDVFVYNRKFRNNNFGSSDIPGVFTLGQATKDDIFKLEQLKEKQHDLMRKLNADKENLEETISSKKKHDEDFRETVWNVILKQNEEMFQEAFIGVRNNKEGFKNKVVEKYKKCHDSSQEITQLNERAKVLFKSKPDPFPEIILSVGTAISVINENENDTVWQKVVTGSKDIPISKLIQSLGNSDWVNAGRAFINDNITCPFCQQKTITEEFKTQLDAFFSGEYEESIAHINFLVESYSRNSNVLLNELRMIALSENRNQEVDGLDINLYNEKINYLDSVIRNNLSTAESKKKEPGKKVSLESTDELIESIIGFVKQAQTSIDNHNNMIREYNDERGKLINDIWDYLMDTNESIINRYISDISDFDKAIDGINKKCFSLEREIQSIGTDIVVAEKNVTSIQPTVDEINRILKAYGFQNFQIAPSPQKENCYQIQRIDGTLATETLSEGEETFITFLYFMQMAKGAVDVLKVSTKRVLIIDDPICSLDSTVLYVVSTMVKELIKKVKNGEGDVEQIFILTHNVFFHKEASFVDGRTQIDSNLSYWILSKEVNTSEIVPYGNKNPINTSYELLWREIKDNSNASLITVQNVMRRIIEYYFCLLGKGRDTKIIEMFDTAEDQLA